MKLPEPFGYMNYGQLSELLTTNLPYGYVYPSKALGASGRLYTEAQMKAMYQQGLEDACKRLTDAGWRGLTALIKGKEDETRTVL